tara:strand:- start:1573 stop:1980 length:408 start_codon:yes stop_codon:yes gene_type:complete
MVTFKNNNRRNNFKRNDRSFKNNGSDRNKFSSNFSSNENFKRKMPGRNNHNAAKLIEKYNNLAREAISGGDKILSESYFQHADHFTRILKEQENLRKNKFQENTSKDDLNKNNLNVEKSETEDIKETISISDKNH